MEPIIGRIHYHVQGDCRVVEYRRYYGRQIVFTASNENDGNRISTINHVEEIILSIARKENLNPRECQFYDLQTYKGYRIYTPGHYRFSKIEVDWREDTEEPVKIKWIDGHCNPGVITNLLGYVSNGDSRIELHNDGVGAQQDFNKMIPPSTIKNFIDLVELYYEINEVPGDEGVHNEYEEILGSLAQLMCKENGIDPKTPDAIHKLFALPRDTPLGTDSEGKYDNLCGFLLEKDPRFHDFINTPLFFE